MLLVLVMGATIWGIGAAMKVPVSARMSMLGLLYLAVLAAHLVLPDGHPLRMATGENPASWLLLGAGATVGCS